VGPDGNVAGGGCYQVGPTDICDNSPDDPDSNPGSVQFQGLTVGDYQVQETTSPDGMQPAANQSGTVSANQNVDVTLTHEALPPQTGGLRFKLQDNQGNPAPGACLSLSTGEEGVAPVVVCDGQQGDADPADASLLINDLPVGTYSVVQTDVNG